MTTTTETPSPEHTDLNSSYITSETGLTDVTVVPSTSLATDELIQTIDSWGMDGNAMMAQARTSADAGKTRSADEILNSWGMPKLDTLVDRHNASELLIYANAAYKQLRQERIWPRGKEPRRGKNRDWREAMRLATIVVEGRDMPYTGQGTSNSNLAYAKYEFRHIRTTEPTLHPTKAWRRALRVADFMIQSHQPINTSEETGFFGASDNAFFGTYGTFGELDIPHVPRPGSFKARVQQVIDTMDVRAAYVREKLPLPSIVKDTWPHFHAMSPQQKIATVAVAGTGLVAALLSPVTADIIHSGPVIKESIYNMLWPAKYFDTQ